MPLTGNGNAEEEIGGQSQMADLSTEHEVLASNAQGDDSQEAGRWPGPGGPDTVVHRRHHCHVIPCAETV